MNHENLGNRAKALLDAEHRRLLATSAHRQEVEAVELALIELSTLRSHLRDYKAAFMGYTPLEVFVRERHRQGRLPNATLGDHAGRVAMGYIAELEAERDGLRQELDCAEAVLDAASCTLPDTDSDGHECLGDYIRAVTQAFIEERDELRTELADAERKGAEEMRDAAADEAIRRGQSCGDRTSRDLVEAILALPLPNCERQAVPMTDEQINAAWRNAGGSFYGAVTETSAIPECDLLGFFRDVAANNLGVRRG